VARGVDRLHARDPEVPLEIGLQERRDEPARGSVDVQRHVEPGARLQVVECSGNLLDRLVAAVEVEPSTPTTPIVFSSQRATASSALR